MNKNYFRVFLLILITPFCLCSCTNLLTETGFYDTDYDVAHDAFDDFLEKTGSKDKNGVGLLFSENARNSITDFDAQIDELFSMFQYKFESYTDLQGGPYVEYERSDGNVKKYMESKYVVKTNGEYYNFLVILISEDTSNPANVGMLAIHIKKAEDSDDLDGINWGDIDDTPGIFIR